MKAIRGEVGRKLRGSYHLQEMEGISLLRKKAQAELAKAANSGKKHRDSLFERASNSPAPNQYTEKAATQELRQKPNYTKSEYVVDMNR